MWLHQRTHLARFDPLIKAPEPSPLRAIITEVQLPVSGQTLFSPGGNIGSLSYSDNTLNVFFAATGVPFGHAVTFEVLLEGAGNKWIPTGEGGSSEFNHLGPGNYVLRVKPLIGSNAGNEATLTFTVAAPWYRTHVAYAIFAASLVTLFVLVGWLASQIERRENLRLERLVNVRTSELHETNLKLNHQIGESLEKAVALKLSNDRFQRLSENAPDIIFRVRVHPEPAYDYISPAVTRIAGFTPEEFYADPSLPARIAWPEGAETIMHLARKQSIGNAVREIVWRTNDGRLGHT